MRSVNLSVSAIALSTLLHSVEAFVVCPLSRSARLEKLGSNDFGVPRFFSAKENENDELESGNANGKYGRLSDLTKETFQKIENDRAELELFSAALQERLKTLDFSLQREELAMLVGSVEVLLQRLLKDEEDTGKVKSKRTYQPADFVKATFDGIKNDLEELVNFQNELQKHLKRSRKDKERLILLDAVVEYRIEELLRKASPADLLEKARLFVEKLIQTEFEPISGARDMRVLKDIPGWDSEEPQNIILRNITEAFWQACIDKVDTPNARYRVCAVGTPGIGKTMTTAILIRMLLLRGETVVYHFRTPTLNDWMYEFKLQNSAVSVVMHPENARGYPEVLKDRRTYYIVDPGNSRANCNPPTRFIAKTIIVSSPDSRNWGERGFTKRYGRVAGFHLVYPLWEVDELVQAREYFDDILTPDEIKSRYERYGGVPRNIFTTPDESGIAQTGQEDALAELTAEHAKSIFKSPVSFVGRMDATQPLSALIGYEVMGNNFSNYKARIVSEQAKKGIYLKHIGALWWTMLNLGTVGWEIFETYICALLTPPPEGPNFEIRSTTLTARPCVGKRPKEVYEKQAQISLGGCTGVTVTDKIVEAAIKGEANIVFRSCNPRHPLIDLMYKDSSGHYFAIQATIGETHKVNVTQLALLEAELGGADKLTFCLLVPDQKFNTFVTVPVDPNENRPGGCEIYHVMVPNPDKDYQRSSDEKQADQIKSMQIGDRKEIIFYGRKMRLRLP